MSLEDIAYKAMIINISDAVVMNAKAQYALLGLKLPTSITQDEVDRLFLGFTRACNEYNITIIGGDTISGDSLDISITIIAKTQNPIKRDNIKVGDMLCYTGELGSVKKDLNILLSGGTISNNSKFIKPILRDKFFYEISEFVGSALDISDGLSKELSRLSQINSIGFEFIKELDEYELCSGEEYEILFSFHRKDIGHIIKIAHKHNLKINIFAEAIRGEYQTICKEHHFG
jgi:thiamine-monophosphate kinase